MPAGILLPLLAVLSRAWAVEPAPLCAEFSAEKAIRAVGAPDAGSARRFAEDLRLYHSCRAYATGRAEECAPLQALPVEAVVRAPEEKKRLARPETHDFLCLSDLHDLRMGAAAIRRDPAGMARACRDHEMIGHRDFTDPARACALLAEHAGDPARACALLEPLFSGPERSKFCFKELLYFQGDPGVCAQLRAEPAAREICLGFDGLRASACGDSPICKALSGGGPEVCAPYLRRVRRGLCGRTQLDADGDARGDLCDRTPPGSDSKKGSRPPAAPPARVCSMILGRRLRRLGPGPVGGGPARSGTALCAMPGEETGGLPGFGGLEAGISGARVPGFRDLLCRTEYCRPRSPAMQRRNTVAELCVVNVIGDAILSWTHQPLLRIVAVIPGADGHRALDAFRQRSSPGPARCDLSPGSLGLPAFEDLVRERCDGYVALRRLLDSGGRVDCGGSDYCRTLTGAGAPVCRALETQVLDRYCAGSTPEALAPGVDEALKGAQASLSLPPSRDLGQAPAAFRARRLKLERLKAELARLWPGRFSAPPAGGDKTPRDP